MLRTLYIENIAVIEKTSIDFENGLNVLTGETGAGKSIIIDAINAIMGQRTSKEIIRTEADSAFVSAQFDDINQSIVEKLDELGDPMVNEYHILAAGFATKEEIDTITEMAFKINEIMIEFFKQCKVDLIDFKIEFGRYKGKILLADEISPDTCRFWDMDTQEKLDKDRFRRDMGGVEEAYAEMMKRVGLA